VSSIAHEAPFAPTDGVAAQQAALIRVAGLLLDGAGQDAVFRAVARELAALTGATRAELTRYEPDGSAPAVGSWAATARRGFRRQRIVVHDRSRARAWGVVKLTAPTRAHDAEAIVVSFLDLVAPALGSAQARQALDDARERSVRAADRVRADLAEQLRSGPRRRLRQVGDQLTAARTALPEDRARALAMIGAARATLTAGMDELQQLARGIHPMLLSERGLDAAVAHLVDACPVQVALHGRVGRRLAEGAELAAYYVVDHGLRRAAERTRTTSIEVTLRLDAGRLRVDVEDDAVAEDAGQDEGPELVEVRDRLTALGGELAVARSRLGGRALHARIPALGDDG
jgi:signal transduction histidine kinase